MMWVLWLTWCFPQTALGAVVTLVVWLKSKRRKLITFKGVRVLETRVFRGGISLGPWIVIDRGTFLNHEYGHTRQSLILGPLYLLVIGLPSLVWATLHVVGVSKAPYGVFYTERWADRLGG